MPNLRLSAVICVLIFLFAFAVRIYDLDGQSMWNDEGLSLHRAGLPLATIASNVITVDGFDTTDTNPPLYFFLLHFWRGAVGDTIFGLRFLGVLLGLVSVALMYCLGRLAFGRTAGLVAAALLAISPFHVWQSQEMRNYSLLIALNLLSVYALCRFLFPAMRRSASAEATAPVKGRWGWLALSLGAGLLAIYTHYFAFFVFAYLLLALLLFALRGYWWRWRWLWVGLALAAVALVPILPVAFGRFQAGQQSGFGYVPPLHILSHAASAYSVGFRPTVVQPLWRVAPVVGLALVGVVVGLASGRRQRVTLLLLGYLVVPLIFLIVLSAINPLYNGPRHLLMGLPPFLLLAAGVGRFAKSPYEKKRETIRWLPTVTVAALLLFTIGSQVAWLDSQFSAPELIKDDLRGAAEWISEAAGPHDVVIVHDALIRFAFDPYYDGVAPVLTVPRFSSGDEEGALAALAAAGAGAEHVWFVSRPEPRDGFPAGLLPRWANQNWARLLSRSYPYIWLGVTVEVYGSRPMAAPSPTASEPLLAWENGLALWAADLPATAAPGEVWWPRFEWQLPEGGTEGYSVSLRLLDSAGELWLQADQPLWPVVWPLPEGAAGLVRRDYPIELPAGLPPGPYQMWVRLLEEGRPVAQGNGAVDGQLAGALMVQSATGRESLTRLPEHTPLAARFGRELALVGYHLPDGRYQPGHLLLFDLYWRADGRPAADYRLRLQLLDPAGGQVAENIIPLTRADYPPTRWQPGEILRTQAYLVIPANITAGSHMVQLSLLPPEGERPIRVRSGGQLWGQAALTLATATLDAPPIQTALPTIESPLRAGFGEPAVIELHGYELEGVARPGETMTLTLVWRGAAAMEVNYTVFVHLTDEAGEVAGQGDGQPDRGFRPTNSWRNGEVIVDEHALSIGPDAPPGRYQLWIGFYHPETGERLPVLVDGSRQADDRLLLQEVVLP